MDPRQMFFDDRLRGLCAFCDGVAETNDHVPSKVLLDKPYPEDLAGVGACERCNNGFSIDEEYLACFIECVVCGTTSPDGLSRPKIQDILRRKPPLAAQIEACRRELEPAKPVWIPEAQRVRNVVMKLARGHLAFWFCEPRLDEPKQIVIVPLTTLSAEQREAFETVRSEGDIVCWPEIGSRAFMQVVVADQQAYNPVDGWTVLQKGRYRYAIPYQDCVRIVLSEYLACEVLW
jgi:hypothetical protein